MSASATRGGHEDIALLSGGPVSATTMTPNNGLLAAEVDTLPLATRYQHAEPSRTYAVLPAP